MSNDLADWATKVAARAKANARRDHIWDMDQSVVASMRVINRPTPIEGEDAADFDDPEPAAPLAIYDIGEQAGAAANRAAHEGKLCACQNEFDGWHYVMGDCLGPFEADREWGSPRPSPTAMYGIDAPVLPIHTAIDAVHAARKRLRLPIEWPEAV